MAYVGARYERIRVRDDLGLTQLRDADGIGWRTASAVQPIDREDGPKACVRRLKDRATGGRRHVQKGGVAAPRSSAILERHAAGCLDVA